jgi:serpin B
MTPFALCLAKHLATASGGANLVFSPLSIYAALALVGAGARGRTLQELLDALGAGSRDELAALVGSVVRSALADQSRSGGPAVAFATGMWHDAACVIRPGFRDAAAASYKAETRAVDLRNEVHY